MRFRKRLIVAAITGIFSTPVVAQPRHVLEAGSVRVVVQPRRGGMSILLDGVEVTKHSELVVTTPGWTPHFYVGPTENAVDHARLETVEGGTRLLLTHVGEREAFQGTETITLWSEGRIEQKFVGRLAEEGAEALIQWRIGAINPAIIAGKRFEAVLKNGERVEGRSPIQPLSGEVGEATLARGFRTITFDSRLGPVRIEVESPHDLIVYDFRKSRWADPGDPFFWFGDLGTRFRHGETVEYSITYHLPAGETDERERRTVTVNAATTPAPDAQIVRLDDPPTIVPKPKEASFESRYAEINDVTGLVIGVADEDSEGVAGMSKPAAAALERWLRQRWSNDPSSDSGGTGGDSPTRQPAIRFIPLSAGDDLPREAYRLNVTPEEVRIRARDERGYFNGLQTLKQLAVPGREGSILVRCCTIADWPALSFRGVHLFTGGRGPDLHNRLIEDVVAACKLNHVVLEAEYVEWDSHPEIQHAGYGMPKADVRKILSACRSLGIEVIPLVQSLGHCQWMFEHDQNLELAEDPAAKWAYCVTNPKTYDFIFEIYAEAIELFEPRWFHIGHDEFANRGRVPFREESRKHTVEELFMMDTKRLHAWFAERDIRVMMWGDMLLAEGEAPDACHAESVGSARALREQLPDDIIITDWHYAATAPEKFTSLDIFQRAGHETIAATWYRPANIVNFARAAHQHGALGLLQTTWAGYSLDPQSYEREIHQYEVYVLAAEAAWNADRPPDPATYRAGWHYYDLTGESSLRPRERAGRFIHLDAAYNYSLTASDPQGWFGLGPRHDLSAAPSGDARLRGLRFALGKSSAGSAVVLDGKLAADEKFPAAIQIDTDCDARELAIVHATNFEAAHGARIAEYEVTFEDGSTARMDLVYGKNVFAYNDLSAAPHAPVIWHGATPAGEAVALRVLIWSLGDRSRSVRRLTLRSANAPASIMVLGVTALDAM